MAESAGNLFVWLWIVSRGVSWLLVLAMVWWAVRNREFESQDRARRLPLESGLPEEREGGPHRA